MTRVVTVRSTHRFVVRTIGIARARTKIGLANLLYNMQRMVWLIEKATAT
jgi:hypothetical protein